MSDKIVKRKVGDRTIEIGGIGPDVDLDEEEFYTADGQRLTEELAEQIAQEMVADLGERRRGRPSVTGKAERTPNLTIRVAPANRRALEAIAQAQGRRVSDVARDALAEYVKRHRLTRAGKATKTTKKAAPRKAVAKKAAPRKASAN